MGLFDDLYETDTARPTGGLFDDLYDAPQKAGQNSGFLGDTATDIKRGLQGIPGMVAGLADIPVAAVSGARPFTRAADWAAQKTGFAPGTWQEQARQEYSPQRRASDTAVDAAWDDPSLSYWEKAAALAQNPRHTVGAVFESLPSMVGGGVGGMAAKGLLARQGLKMSGAAAGGMGEGAVMAGQQMQQYDPNLENQRRAAVGSAATGVAGGLIGMGMGRMAGRLGLEDIDTLVAGGGSVSLLSGATNSIRARIGRGLATGGMEATEEALQGVPETAMQNWENDRPWTENMARNVTEGAMAGGFMGGALGLRARRLPVDLLKQPTEETIYPTEGRTPDMFTGEMGLPKTGLAQQEESISEEQHSIYDDLFPPAPIRTTTGGAPSFGVWSAKSPKKVAAEAARAEKKLTEAVKTEAAKTGKGIPVMTPTALLKARLDKHLAAGEITDVQHQDITNAIDSYGGKNRGRMLAKANKEINDALQIGSAAQVVAREQAQGGQPLGVGQVIGGPQAPGPITVTTPQGETTIAPKEKVNRGKKGRIPVSMPVATEPVPVLPTDATKVPEYEKAMTSYITSGIDPKNLAVVLHVRGLEQDGVEEGGASLRVVAKQNKTSHEQVRKQYLAGLSQLRANAQAAGMDWDMAQELLGIAPPAAIETGLGEGAHNLGEAVRTVMPESDEFEHTAGMTRDETAGEEAPVEAAPEELPAESEISAEDTILETESSAARLEARLPEQAVIIAGRMWNHITGKSFGDLTSAQRVEYIQKVADAQSAVNQTDFEEFLNTLHNAFVAKHGLQETDHEQKPENKSAGRNEKTTAADETGEAVVVGNKTTPGETKVTKRKNRVAAKPAEDKLSTSEDTFAGTTKKFVENVIRKAFFSPQKMNQLVTIFDTVEEALASPASHGKAKTALSSGDRVGGWKSPDGHVYLVAENIYEDKQVVLGTFLHEVGVHLGMEKLIGKANMEALASKVEEWAQLNDGSVENLRARAAVARAKIDIESPHYREELVAYMVSELVESGVNPQALGQSDAHKWFRKLWAAAKAALRHLGLRIEKFTPQNLVDLAYGAADLELRGAWHGTAGEFRKFDHNYMGTGEGAQAYGWGTYLAQRAGVAHEYWKQDVARKSRPARLDNFPQKQELIHAVKADDYLGFDTQTGALQAILDHSDWVLRWEASPELIKVAEEWKNWIQSRSPEGSLMRVASNVRDDEFLDWDKPLSEQSKEVKKLMQRYIHEVTSIGQELEAWKNAMYGVGPQKDATGQDFYALLQRFRQGKGGKEAASKYLDSIGIKGIRFLDAVSRALNPQKDLPRRIEQSKERISRLEKVIAAAKNNEPNGVLKLMDRLVPGQSLKAAKEEDLAFMEEDLKNERGNLAAFEEQLKNPPKTTSNLVIFNDKNLVRVKTQVGASQADEAIKFSKSEESRHTKTYGSEFLFKKAEKYLKKQGYAAARVEKLESGKVEVRWVPPAEGPKFSISAPMKEAAVRLAGPTGEKLVSEASGALKVATGHIEFLHNIVDRVKKTLPSAKVWHDAMLKMQSSREIMERKAEEVAVAVGKLKLAERDKVNSFIAKSTKDQKWGYQPTWLSRVVTIDADMAGEWRKLTPEQQAVADSVFKHGEETSNKVNGLFKSLGIEGVFTKMGKLEGPYAPLMRFGNFVGVVKSQDLLDAEKTASAEDATTAELDKVEDLKKDEKHFRIEHFDTRSQADQFAKVEGKKYAFSDSFAKSSQTENKNSIGYKQLSRVMAALKADQDIPSAAKAAIEDTINAMYMASVDQHSARASMQKRGGYAGFEKDMIRSFLANARAQAGFVSNLEFGPEVNNAFYAMREEVKDQTTGKRVNQDDLNQLTEHYAENMNSRATPITDRIVGLTSAMQLATSIGYHLNNLSQVPMVTIPQLAADFKDYSSAWSHAMAGYATAKKIWKGGKFNLEMLGTGSGLYKALKVIESRQLLDVGLEENLGHYERFRTGFAAADKVTTVASNALHKLRQVSRTVEMINRISSATAAYNMAIEHGKSHEAAQDYAIGIVENTQGNFTRMDAPLILKKMGPAGKVIGQYRKFQFLMMSFYMRAYGLAFRGATADEKALGKRMLAYKLFHTSVAAGLLGFPLMNLAAFAFGLAGGDEPDDLEAWTMDKVEALVGDKDLAKMLLRGPLSYVGFGTKLGDDRVFSLLPYTDIDFSSKASTAKTLYGAAGPAFGQLGKFADGVGFMQRGDMYKGVEKFMPKGLESAMQSFRIANDGYTLKNGDVMVKPEDLSEFSLALHAVGMTAPEMMDIQRTQNLQFQITTYYAEKTTELEHRFAEARRDHDTAEMGQIRREWIELQKSKDEQRKHFNFSHDALKKQPLSNLLKYPQLVRKRERATQRQVPE